MTVSLAGELDTSASALVDGMVAEARARSRGTVVVDASRLTFVDLAGRRALARAAAVPGVVMVAGPAVRRLDDYVARSHDRSAA
jgi:hypothetical protein